MTYLSGKYKILLSGKYDLHSLRSCIFKSLRFENCPKDFLDWGIKLYFFMFQTSTATGEFCIIFIEGISMLLIIFWITSTDSSSK